MSQRLGHAAMIRLAIGPHHAAHVQPHAAPARHDDGRARTLELRERHANQRPGVFYRRAPGHRHWLSQAGHDAGDVKHGQALAGQVEQLLQRLLVVVQPGRRVDVAGHARFFVQRRRAADDRLGHLDRVYATGEGIGDKDDRLGRGVEHHLHLVAVGDLLMDVAWEEHGHDKVHLFQRIAHGDALDDILQLGLATLPGAVIYHVEAIGAWPEEGVVAFNGHDR